MRFEFRWQMGLSDDLKMILASRAVEVLKNVWDVVEKFRSEPKVIKPAFEMSLHLSKVEFGSYLLRSLKNIDKKQFMKAGSSALDKVLVDKVIDRYAKFIFKDADVEAS